MAIKKEKRVEYIKRLLGLDKSIATFNVYKKGQCYRVRIKYKGMFDADQHVYNIFSTDSKIEKIELISKTWL